MFSTFITDFNFLFAYHVSITRMLLIYLSFLHEHFTNCYIVINFSQFGGKYFSKLFSAFNVWMILYKIFIFYLAKIIFPLVILPLLL